VKAANRKFAEKRRVQKQNRDVYSIDESEKQAELRRQKHFLDPLYFN
jgi:hypothetical protein